MKLISKEEAKKLRLQKAGKKHAVNAAIEIMEVGQLLQVEPQDMRWKNFTPSYFCNKIKKRTDRTFEVTNIPGDKGWVVERLS